MRQITLIYLEDQVEFLFIIDRMGTDSEEEG